MVLQPVQGCVLLSVLNCGSQPDHDAAPLTRAWPGVGALNGSSWRLWLVLAVGLADVTAVTFAQPSPAQGWYPDPTHPGLLRWFDGTTWTEQTVPAALGQPATPVMSGHAGAPLRSRVGLSVVPGGSITPLSAQPVPPAAWRRPPGVGAAPSDAAHWLLPLGRTWQSIVAGYVALFATVLWILGPVALGFGIAALRASAAGRGHGRGRAWFAVIVGALATFALVLAVLARL
jgi:hypothetical protein